LVGPQVQILKAVIVKRLSMGIGLPFLKGEQSGIIRMTVFTIAIIA
jgi:hypothetical protein